MRVLARDLATIRADLVRPHPFAYERVGYLACKVGRLTDDGLMLLPWRYAPVTDDGYIPDDSVGAMLNAYGLRQGLQIAFGRKDAVFHLHVHDHTGQPGFSTFDVAEARKFVPDFFKVGPRFPHGTLVLSRDSITGLCWLPRRRLPVEIADFSIIGRRCVFVREGACAPG